jgi:LuxR family maltose regulon positive regulatory protein
MYPPISIAAQEQQAATPVPVPILIAEHMTTFTKAQEKSLVPGSLPSKFRPPAAGAHFVVRERATERIRQAGATKLILVQAPPGFGITCLLRHLHDLFRADGWAIAWLTLDAGDNDLDRLMSCLHQALAHMPRSPWMTDTGRLPMTGDDGFDLAQSIASTPVPFMLILDEFEHLQNPAALAVIQQLVEMLGPQQRIAIGSRVQPTLSVGRLRARQQLLEIDASQLRFTLEETTRFLCDRRRLRLDADDIVTLHQVTGGWPAALWLSSLALENNEHPKRFIRNFSGSHTAVASYLAEEVLSCKPKYLQDFILQTSVLQKFCADSCDAVTGRHDSRELLRELERANMFLTPIDEQRNWFRYHPLFAGFLRAQLERQYPGLATTLHYRAVSWYIEQKRPTHAIEHAIATGDTVLILDLLARHAESLFLQGRVRLLARWFDATERVGLVVHPKLILVYAWSLIHINRSAEALTLLETVTDEYGVSPVPHPTYHVLRIFSLVMLDRIEQTAPLWDDPRIIDGAADEPLLRSMLMIGCAYYYATAGRYQEAHLLLDQATHQHPSVGPLFSIAVAGYVRGMLDLVQGRLRAASARLVALIGDESQMRSRTSGVHGGAHFGALIGIDSGPSDARYGADSGFASVYLAEVLYEMDTLREAKRLLKLYLPLLKDAGIPDQLIASHLIYARILRAEGQAGDALHTLLELEQLGMQRRLPRIIDMARLEQARGAILDGDLEAAKAMLSLVGNAPAWQRRDLQMIASDLDTPALAALRLQVHCGQAAAALPLLKEQLQEAHARGRVRFALRVKALHALALSNAGQRNPALRAIRETLHEAQQEGFVRLFKDEGPALLALIREMRDSMQDSGTEQGMLLAFVEKILRPAPHLAPVARNLAVDGVAVPDVGDSELTGRELDVLMLLAQGCGNQVIAEKLFVSITTVKTHLRNINLKLGAHNRTEAISVARRMGVIA